MFSIVQDRSPFYNFNAVSPSQYYANNSHQSSPQDFTSALRELMENRISQEEEEYEKRRILKQSLLRKQKMNIPKKPFIQTSENSKSYQIRLLKNRGDFNSYSVESFDEGNYIVLTVSSTKENFNEQFKFKKSQINILDIDITDYYDSKSGVVFLMVDVPKYQSVFARKEKYRPSIQKRTKYIEEASCGKEGRFVKDIGGLSAGQFLNPLERQCKSESSNRKGERKPPSQSFKKSHKPYPDQETKNKHAAIFAQDNELNSFLTEIFKSAAVPKTNNEKKATVPSASKSVDSQKRQIKKPIESKRPAKLFREPSLEVVEDEEITRYNKSNSELN